MFPTEKLIYEVTLIYLYKSYISIKKLIYQETSMDSIKKKKSNETMISIQNGNLVLLFQ